MSQFALFFFEDWFWSLSLFFGSCYFILFGKMSPLCPLHSTPSEDPHAQAPSVLPKLNFSIFDFPTPDFILLRTGSETRNNALAFKPAPPLASKPLSLTKLSLCVLWYWGVVWGSEKGCVHICICGWENKMDNWILNKWFILQNHWICVWFTVNLAICHIDDRNRP